MADINVTFGNSRLADLCLGLDRDAYDANPPQTVAEGEAFVKARIIDRLKIAHKRGLEINHKSTFVDVPFDDILS